MNGWKFGFDSSVLGMAILRFLSASVELTAAILMLVFNDITKAILINSFLAIIGPCILVFTMTIGLVGIAGEISYGKLLLIGLGVLFIVIGILK